MLKPWREVAVPHEDVLKGTFQQAEFAADLSRVHDGTATDEYQKPTLFFQRTFVTEGMSLLLDSVVKRLTGRGGDPVIQLQTAFGGGKTHTMLAVYHLAKGEVPASDLPGIPPILDAAKITELPRANMAVLDGNNLAPNMPRKRGKTLLRTLWGELAWQLGKDAGYAQVKEADESGTSPGKEVLTQLLAAYAPCVILIDELVAYVRQFEEGKTYTGGTYDSNLSFIQALTEALKAVPNAVLLASLPESDKEAGSQRGIKALRTLEHYFARVHTLWKPVATEEAFEIVRRRLFSSIGDDKAADTVCRAFADLYISNSADVPQETQESRYFDRLKNAYPIHPEVFDRLYSDWSSLDNFQRTRGVLQLMAKVIYRLWKDGNNDLLIMPGSFPLYDASTRNDALYYLPQGWDPVVERDIDGDRAETTDIENRDTRFGAVQACRRVARTTFLGSAPTTANQMLLGIELNRVLLGCVQPGQQIGVYKDALHRLVDRLHFLNHGNDRYWFDTRPNLRREMEERKKRFKDIEDVTPAIRDRLQKMLGTGVFGGVHVFTPSGDVPDDWALRLVVLSPEATFNKTGQGFAVERATEILKTRGEQPRQKGQNRLIFLAADYDIMARLRDQVRSLLAWQSIVTDIKDAKLNLDQLQARQATKSFEEATVALKRMILEAFKWLLTPTQDVRPGKGLSDLQWEHFALNPGASDFTNEIVRLLKDNELLITEWAPIHLSNMLKAWFWKPDVPEVGAQDVWQKTCQYLYLPRLREEKVFANTLTAGTDSRDFFGLAQAKQDGRYIGFSFAKPGHPVLDGSLLVIEPTAAAAYADARRAEEQARTTATPGTIPATSAGLAKSTAATAQAVAPTGDPATARQPESGGTAKQPTRRQFYGSIELDPIQAKKQFADIVDEVVMQFTSRPGVKVKIAIEIEAESPAGFDDGIQRAVKENCNVLKFKNAEFETDAS